MKITAGTGQDPMWPNLIATSAGAAIPAPECQQKSIAISASAWPRVRARRMVLMSRRGGVYRSVHGGGGHVRQR